VSAVTLLAPRLSPGTFAVPLECAVEPAEHGGKAVGLGRLIRGGLPVPPGFVIGHSVFEQWLAAAGDDVGPAVDHVTHIPRDAYASLAEMASALAGSGPLAVRSSAAGEDGASASFAGQLESVLGVQVSGLEQALKRVWASRGSARAAAYATARGTALTGMGVIVQRQVDAQYAGVLFTVSPEPGRSGEMLCEYDEGLGDRLVAGEVSPGRIAISRATLTPEWKCDLPGARARPPLDAIARLARAAQAAEKLFGSAQDIEWAIDRAGEVWLLQSRPITTRPRPAARSILWSNANVNENFPQPICPLLYSVAAAGYTRYFRGLGEAFGVSAARLERMEPDLRTIIGVHAGRMYYNLTSIHAVLRDLPFGRVLSRWFDQFVGATGPEAERTPTARRRPGEVLELARIACKTTWQYLFLSARLRAFERDVDRYAARTAQPALEHKSLIELRDDVRAFLDIRLRRWTGAGLSDVAAMASYGALKALLSRAFPAAQDAQVHHDLLKGLDDLASAAPVNALWDLSRQIRADERLSALFATFAADEIESRLAHDAGYAAFKAALDAYLESWGYRFSGELMLTEPSFQERPEALIAILARYAAQDGESPHARLDVQRRDRIQRTARVLDALAQRPLVRGLAWPSMASIARPVIAAAQFSIACRERARLKQALLYNRLRRVALVIGARLVAERRLASRDDVFFLTAPELDELLSGTAMFAASAGELVALRRRAHEAFAAMQPPDVMTAAEGEYPACTPDLAAPHASGAELRGTSVCGGVAIGRARVLLHVDEACGLEAGDILVTRQTDPGWAPVFVAIRGLVLERGGMLSHGAILAREYGIPTVVGVAGAVTDIPDGVTVRVDGDRGVVDIVR
jgi:phosphohistidine swiveling domain-containing protein